MRSNKKERQGRGCSEALQTIVWLSADARCDEFFYPLASTFEFRFHQSPCSLHLNIVSLVTTNESIVKDRYTAYLTKATIRANSLPPPLFTFPFFIRVHYIRAHVRVRYRDAHMFSFFTLLFATLLSTLSNFLSIIQLVFYFFFFFWLLLFIFILYIVFFFLYITWSFSQEILTFSFKNYLDWNLNLYSILYYKLIEIVFFSLW